MLKELINKITTAEMRDILNEFNVSLKKTAKKAEVMEEFDKLIKGKKIGKKYLYELYGHRIALHPTTVEQTLGITKTERLRWQEEGKLKVSHYEPFSAYGRDFECPYYDYKQIHSVTQDRIEKWREKHKEKVTKNRKKGAKKAGETRKNNKELIKSFYEDEWAGMVKTWESIDKELAATFKLSFWTMWTSRIAKEFQEKAHRATIKNYEKYIEKKEEFYQYKNIALELLTKSKYTKISFYRPADADKLRVTFCDFHYNDWCEQRRYSFAYMDKWEYYYCNSGGINKCPNCNVERNKDYYSLYYLEIASDKVEDYKFSFHTPFPLANKEIYPDIKEIPKVKHEENTEGLFRFGRSMFEEELVVFTENRIRKFIEESINDFKSVFECN